MAQEKPCFVCGETRVLYYANKKFFCKQHRKESIAAAQAGKEQWRAETEPRPKFACIDGMTVRDSLL